MFSIIVSVGEFLKKFKAGYWHMCCISVDAVIHLPSRYFCEKAIVLSQTHLREGRMMVFPKLAPLLHFKWETGFYCVGTKQALTKKDTLLIMLQNDCSILSHDTSLCSAWRDNSFCADTVHRLSAMLNKRLVMDPKWVLLDIISAFMHIQYFGLRVVHYFQLREITMCVSV